MFLDGAELLLDRLLVVLPGRDRYCYKDGDTRHHTAAVLSQAMHVRRGAKLVVVVHLHCAPDGLVLGGPRGRGVQRRQGKVWAIAGSRPLR